MSDIRKAIMARLGEFARPGAKAEMGNAEDVRSLIAKAEQMIWTAKRPEQKREVMDLVKDAERMIDASMPSGFRMRLDRLKQRIAREFSRPGAKTEMAKFNSGDSVVVPYGREMVRGKIVRYDEPSMAYVVDIGRYESIKVAKEDVRKAAMSRPGAKSTNALYMIEIVEGGRVTSTITPDQFRNWAVRNIPGVSRNDFLPTMIEKSNEWMRKFDGSQVRIGGKSKNALSDACWQGYEAVGTKKQDGKTVPNCVPKATAAKPESQDIESEEVKAGLKLMEKADEKVSEKIRTLIKEGKPQDQAVAIALDMKRRGEL